MGAEILTRWDLDLWKLEPECWDESLHNMELGEWTGVQMRLCYDTTHHASDQGSWLPGEDAEGHMESGGADGQVWLHYSWSQSTAMQIVLGRVRVANRLLCRLSAQQAVQEQVIEKAIGWVFAGTCCYKPAKGILQLSMARRHLAANHEESRTESAIHFFSWFLLVVAAPPERERERERERGRW